MAESAESMRYQPPQEALPSVDEYRREYDNAATWLAEVLDGSMRTGFEFTFDGSEIYGQDGMPLTPVFDDALRDAHNLVRISPHLRFEMRRRGIERQELDDMFAMLRGERPNTMVVVSDFPPELMDAQEDIGGYNVTRRQTMLRVITCSQDGVLQITSQSLDLSDRTALEAIYAYYGRQPQPGELLGQRLYIDTPEHELPYIADRLTSVYDNSLADRLGGEWLAGRRGEQHQTYEFVRRQADLLHYFVGLRINNTVDAEQQRYALAAMVNERYSQHRLGSVALAIPIDPTGRLIYDQIANLRAEMLQAELRARDQGIDFSGCGFTAFANNPETQKQLEQVGYGNKIDEPEKIKWRYDRLAYCVVCQRPPKEGEGKKMCGPCLICKGCSDSM